jgi:hypothetical protein
MVLPRNFSWLVAGEVAGCACPSSEAELRGLVDAGVRHLVTLSYADSPPPACTATLLDLAWTSLPIAEFQAALWNRNRRNRNFFTSGTGTLTC